ncbi:MAG: biopolymer transporter ExbD [Pseudomonadota bacterium]
MKQSARGKRMARNHRRNQSKSKLSLVSLMDIFTILVFFLMLNASDVQVLQSDDMVKLPVSTADAPAKETLLLLVTREQVMLQGKPITTTGALKNAQTDAIDELKSELDYHSARRTTLNDVEKQQQSITIMGDSSVTFAVLKQIMQACASTGYTNLALAVENKTDTGSALSSGGS